MDINYSDLISRNYLFINPELQEKIETCHLTFMGCGLASIMAEMAVRIGFKYITLVDGDHVEISNMNRQSFLLDDIGISKVKALKQRLLKIDPKAEISIIDKGIEELNDVKNTIIESDIIVNTIDYGQAYFDLVEYASAINKLVICLFNPGFGGLAVCFNKGSANLYALLQTDQVETGLAFSKKLIKNNPGIKIPNSMRDDLDSLFNLIAQTGCEPQISIGTYMSSAIGLTCTIKYLNQEPIPYCPSVIYRDLYDLF